MVFSKKTEAADMAEEISKSDAIKKCTEILHSNIKTYAFVLKMFFSCIIYHSPFIIFQLHHLSFIIQNLLPYTDFGTMSAANTHSLSSGVFICRKIVSK